MKEKIAQELADSGLFGRNAYCESCFAVEPPEEIGEDCMVCLNGEIIDGGVWLGADESEEILSVMGLQAVYAGSNGGRWSVVYFGNGTPVFAFCLPGVINKGQRTLANNAALAWLAKNRSEDLEQTLKSMGKL